jgi:hypothetical protein
MLNRVVHHELQLDCETGVGLVGIDTTEIVETDYLNTEDGDRLVTDVPGVLDAWETTGAPAGGLFVGDMASDGSGRFVALQFNQSVFISDDFGATWTFDEVLTASPTTQDIEFLNGQYIVTATSSTVCFTSPDGETWTPRTISATTRAWRGVAYGNGLYVMVAAGTSTYATSPDGITWTERTHPISGGVDIVVFGAGRFVLLSGAASQYSSDGINWTSTTLPFPVIKNTAFYGGGLFFAAHSNAGPTNLYVTSVDGITWTQRSFPGAATWSAAAYGRGVFVVINSGGTAAGYSSTDAINWESKPPTLSRSWSTIAFSAPYFVALHAGSQTDGNRYRVSSGADSKFIILDKKKTQGVIPKVMLRWSDDGGHTWSREHWRDMGRIGKFGTRVIWRRLGMTAKLRDRVYEVSGTDPVKIAIMGAELRASKTDA